MCKTSSRWGRIQDADEGAHGEVLSRRAGLEVIAIAAPFDNDGRLPSTLVKHLKGPALTSLRVNGLYRTVHCEHVAPM